VLRRQLTRGIDGLPVHSMSTMLSHPNQRAANSPTMMTTKPINSSGMRPAPAESVVQASEKAICAITNSAAMAASSRGTPAHRAP